MNNETKKRLQAIRERLKSATPGPWVYDASRHTHDCPIHREGAVDVEYGYVQPAAGQGGDGVVGSSEWIWLRDEDGEFIAHARADIEWLLGLISPEVKRS